MIQALVMASLSFRYLKCIAVVPEKMSKIKQHQIATKSNKARTCAKWLGCIYNFRSRCWWQQTILWEMEFPYVDPFLLLPVSDENGKNTWMRIIRMRGWEKYECVDGKGKNVWIRMIRMWGWELWKCVDENGKDRICGWELPVRKWGWG